MDRIQFIENTTEVVSREEGVDLVLCGVRVKEDINKFILVNLLKENSGVFGSLNLFDGQEYSCVQIGNWLGASGSGYYMALRLMAICKSAGFFELSTPKQKLWDTIPPTAEKHLAKSGGLTMRFTPDKMSNGLYYHLFPERREEI